MICGPQAAQGLPGSANFTSGTGRCKELNCDQYSLDIPVVQYEDGKPVCVYWDELFFGGWWLEKGCNVLKSNGDIEEPFQQQLQEHLQMITRVGLSPSLVCLLICIITFSYFRSIRGTRNTIHLNLCISLFAANLIFLIGITRTESTVGCGIVAGLLHWLFLSAFCWMCQEGVQLYHIVALIFHMEMKFSYMLAVGYGIPSVIVVISAIINLKGYGTEKYCWLTRKDHFIWSFFGPVIAGIHTACRECSSSSCTDCWPNRSPGVFNTQ
ncbi:CD97 antigen-like [Arapaima gigas]